jgi:hypothetical protein
MSRPAPAAPTVAVYFARGSPAEHLLDICGMLFFDCWQQASFIQYI